MIPFYITRYDILYYHINLIHLASPNARPQLPSETTRSLDGGTHSSRSPCMRRYDYITDTCKQTQSRTAINKPARLYIHTPNVTHVYCLILSLQFQYVYLYVKSSQNVKHTLLYRIHYKYIRFFTIKLKIISVFYVNNNTDLFYHVKHNLFCFFNI